MAYLNAVRSDSRNDCAEANYFLHFLYLKGDRQKLAFFDIVRLGFVLCFEEYDGYLVIHNITWFTVYYFFPKKIKYKNVVGDWKYSDLHIIQ